MVYHKRHSITAVLVTAVIAIGLMASGCATKRDVKDINARLDKIEEGVRSNRNMVARMDSMLTANTEASRQLQNDVRYSTDELSTQMNQLLANYNDLVSRLNEIAGNKTIYVPPTSSKGSQTDPLPGTGTTATPPPPPTSMADEVCQDLYDSLFQTVRRGEYDQAITGFQSFMTQCPTHQDIPNAIYWMGESYYSLDKHQLALEQYQKLAQTYPNSSKLVQALYKSARCNQELGKKDEARKLYQQVSKDFAGTLEARQAEERLKDL